MDIICEGSRGRDETRKAKARRAAACSAAAAVPIHRSHRRRRPLPNLRIARKFGVVNNFEEKNQEAEEGHDASTEDDTAFG